MFLEQRKPPREKSAACCWGFLDLFHSASEVHARKRAKIHSCELLRPRDSRPVDAAAAERLPMPAIEYFWATEASAATNGYNGRAFILPRADPDRLKSALAACLQHYEHLAGRWCGRDLVFTNEGVPFTIVEAPEACAPVNILNLELLSRYCDYCRRDAVAQGKAPLLTVKLTVFKDRSAVLGLATSHSVLDGASTWAFVNEWASFARGEGSTSTTWDRKCVREHLLSEEAFQAGMKRLYGKEVKPASRLVSLKRHVMLRLAEHMFFRGRTLASWRPVSFSNADVEHIKRAATPAPGSGGDGWVTTQEALAAHLAIALARATLPPGSAGNVKVCFVCDIRPLLGLSPGESLGCGFLDIACYVPGILQRTLPDVAECLHEGLKDGKSNAREKWSLILSGFEAGVGLEAWLTTRNQFPSDLDIGFNNQSKKTLPDFGEASGGTARRAFFENTAGTHVVLPEAYGITINVACTAPGALRAFAHLPRAGDAIRSA